MSINTQVTTLKVVLNNINNYNNIYFTANEFLVEMFCCQYNGSIFCRALIEEAKI